MFYKISGGTFGLQIGGTKGALAFFLMSDKAIDAFENKASTWPMDAGATFCTRQGPSVAARSAAFSGGK